MRKTKLTAAILTICVGALMALSCMANLAELDEITPAPDKQDLYDSLQAIFVVLLLVSVTLIVFGSIFCRQKRHKGICITILVLMSIFALLQFLGMSNSEMEVGSMNYLVLAAMVAVVVLSIVYLVQLSKTSPNKSGGEVMADVLGGTAPAPQNEAPSLAQALTPPPSPTPAKSTGDVENRIEMLKKLHKDGIINADELKESIKKELDKS